MTEAKAPDTWNDGVSAFPYVTQGNQGPFVHPGMGLRDWFAGMALQGRLSDSSVDLNTAERAKDAYSLADAMLIERAK